MGTLILKLRSFFLGKPVPLMELRLFRLLCLAGTLLTLFVVIPVDCLLHLSPGIIIAEFVFSMAAFIFYRESYRGHYHITSLFILFMLNLNLSWFADGASQGSISFYFFNAYIYLLIFFRGKTRWLLLGLAIANGVGLIASELYFPQWVVPHHSQVARLADLITSLTVCAVSCSLMIWAVLTSYDREQERLTSLNAELERHMAERIQTEKSLRQNRELLNAVIEGTSDAVYAKDTEGRYVLFNKAAECLTGKSAAEALGNNDSLLFSCDNARAIMENRSKYRGAGDQGATARRTGQYRRSLRHFPRCHGKPARRE